MKRKLLLAICLCLLALNGYAQSYQWIKGGGSTETMSIDYNWEKVSNMCTDDDGNVYITAIVGATSISADTFYEALAHNTFSSNSHILLASYRCDGTMRWAKLIECNQETFTENLSYSNGALAYSNGSVYFAGSFQGGYTKYIGFDTTFRFVGPDVSSTPDLAPYAGVLAIDGQGYIHNFDFMNSGVVLTGSVTSDSACTYDLKYDSTGNLLSAAKVRLPLDSLWTITKAAFNKEDGKFYTLLLPNNHYASTLTTALCAFKPDESMLWMDTTAGGGGVFSMDYKGGNEIYVCGSANYPDTLSFGGVSVTDTIFPIYYASALVYKLDTNGVAHWVYNLQSSLGIDRFNDVAILPGGKVAATGVMTGTSIHGTDTLISPTTEGQNPLFVVMDSSGHTVKLDQFHGSGFYDEGWCITTDAVGNVYTGGQLVADMAATGLTSYLTNGGNTDFYLLKYGVDCSCTTAPVASYTLTGHHTISATYTGTTAGLDSVVWNFGDGSPTYTGTTATHTYSDTGIYYVCVTVYTSCGSDSYCSNVIYEPSLATSPGRSKGEEMVQVFPNPANDELSITGVPEGTSYVLTNITGVAMQQGKLQQGSNIVSMQHFAAGIYILEMTGADGEKDIVRVVKN